MEKTRVYCSSSTSSCIAWQHLQKLIRSHKLPVAKDKVTQAILRQKLFKWDGKACRARGTIGGWTGKEFWRLLKTFLHVTFYPFPHSRFWLLFSCLFFYSFFMINVLIHIAFSSLACFARREKQNTKWSWTIKINLNTLYVTLITWM